MVVEVDAPDLPGGKVYQVGIPLHLSETPGQVRQVGSVTGQHTEEILAEIMGYDKDQVNQLREEGVV